MFPWFCLFVVLFTYFFANSIVGSLYGIFSYSHNNWLALSIILASVAFIFYFLKFILPKYIPVTIIRRTLALTMAFQFGLILHSCINNLELVLTRKAFIYEITTQIIVDNQKLYVETIEVSSGIYINIFIISIILYYWLGNQKSLEDEISEILNSDKEKGHAINYGGFLTDESPENIVSFYSGVDYDSTVRKIFSRIISTNSLNEALAIGIIGSWGSGKTVFAKYCYKLLYNENRMRDLILPIWFEPWWLPLDKIYQ